MLTDAAVITQNATLSGTGQWSSEDSDPIMAIEAQKATIMASAQVMPNTLVLPYEVYSQVRIHPRVIERIAYGSLGAVNEALLAQIFDVEQVLVPRAFKNTAAPGKDPSMAYVWGKNALLCYVPQRAGLKQMALSYTFAWTGAAGSIDGHRVEMWREERRKADVIRVQRYYDQKVIAPGTAFLWKSAVA